MEEKKTGPVFPEQFRTSARPIYLRYGALILFLSAIFLYLYYEGREAPVSIPSPLEGLDGAAQSSGLSAAPNEEIIKLTD